MEMKKTNLFDLINDPNDKDNMNDAFFTACIEGNLGRVKSLTASGCRVNQVSNRSGRTPLHEACRNGHDLLVHFLLNKLGKLSTRTKMGNQTALHLAVVGNHEGITRLLIAHGIDINAQDKFGLTPLHCVIGEGCLYALLEGNANALIRSKTGESPFKCALRRNVPNLAVILRDAEVAQFNVKIKAERAKMLEQKTKQMDLDRLREEKHQKKLRNFRMRQYHNYAEMIGKKAPK